MPRDNCRCPWCDSLERHRFLWAYLRARTDLFDHQPRTVLHFAPEAFLEPRLRRLPRLRYLGLDYEIGRADLAGDITRLGIATGAVDGILCSHVLEHIPDDRGAMLELRRVLKPGGWGVLMVPIGGTATDEDPSVTDPAERLRRFKQHDHVRIYGLDFADRLRAAGFAVEVVLAQEVLDEEERRLQRVPGDQLLFRVERGG